MTPTADEYDAFPELLSQAVGAERIGSEQELWHRLTPNQKHKATIRLNALSQWRERGRDADVSSVAATANLRPSQFYKMVAEWHATPGLAVLGVHAGAGRNRRTSPALEAQLTEAARTAILRYGRLSISQLVNYTVELAGLPLDSIPKTSKLRELVKAERRRLECDGMVGQSLVFDFVATSMARDDLRPHIAFMAIDEGSNLVLGVAIGEVEDILLGYSKAAADALKEVEARGAQWSWHPSFRLGRFASGRQFDVVHDFVLKLNKTYPQQHFMIETGARRCGRMIIEAVGQRMDRVSFTPTKTFDSQASAVNNDMKPWSLASAEYTLRQAKASHNEALQVSERRSNNAIPEQFCEFLLAVSHLPDGVMRQQVG